MTEVLVQMQVSEAPDASTKHKLMHTYLHNVTHSTMLCAENSIYSQSQKVEIPSSWDKVRKTGQHWYSIVCY
jgi:hypothetical protein